QHRARRARRRAAQAERPAAAQHRAAAQAPLAGRLGRPWIAFITDPAAPAQPYMDFDLYLRFALALILVLGLIALLAWVLRRFGMGMKLAKGRRLGIVEIQSLGPRHRLILLRRDQVEHL